MVLLSPVPQTNLLRVAIIGLCLSIAACSGAQTPDDDGQDQLDTARLDASRCISEIDVGERVETLTLLPPPDAAAPCQYVNNAENVVAVVSFSLTPTSRDFARLVGAEASPIETMLDEAFDVTDSGASSARIVARRGGTAMSVQYSPVERGAPADSGIALKIAEMHLDDSRIGTGGEYEVLAGAEEAACDSIDPTSLLDLFESVEVGPLIGDFGCEFLTSDSTHVRMDVLPEGLTEEDLMALEVASPDEPEPVAAVKVDVGEATGVWLADPAVNGDGRLYLTKETSTFLFQVVAAADAEVARLVALAAATDTEPILE